MNLERSAIVSRSENMGNVNVPLTLENTVIKQVTETKFLGVLIDQHLSWKPPTDFVSKKFRKVWELLRKPAFTYHPNL